MTGGTSVAERLAAAEPTSPRELGTLVERLSAAGLLRGAREGGRPIGAAGLADLPVSALAYDSRRVRRGGLFVAVPGEHVDGHEFVPDAVRAGATALIVERAIPEAAVPQLVVGSSLRALGIAAGWWYGDPSHSLGIVGITGTDGKTTTSFLATAALAAAGVPTGMLGTVELAIGGSREPNPEHVTTPQAPELHAALRAMVDGGDKAAVVETTSHGLALGRVEAVEYDAAVLTNLTHEHLELHGTFEAYRAAKLSLFERLARRTGPKDGRAPRWDRAGIVNHDDASGPLFEAVVRESGARLVTYGTADGADVRAIGVEEDSRRLRVRYAAPSGEATVNLRLAGRFNAHNALAVVALGEALGLDAAAVRDGLESMPGVPGRMERIHVGQPFGVIIDYAHSPASLEKVLDLLAPLAAARGGGLVVVFGSAGERDRAKRPMMGRIAGERCRLVVVTDEDPRGEDREGILDEIARGAEAAGRRRGHDLLVIADRRAAIGAAFDRARAGDVVLLAGKGHEHSIIGPTGPVAWSERDAALDALADAGYRAPTEPA